MQSIIYIESDYSGSVQLLKMLIFGAGALALIGAATGYICLKEFERREQKEMNDKMIDKVESINEAVQAKADKVKGEKIDPKKIKEEEKKKA